MEVLEQSDGASVSTLSLQESKTLLMFRSTSLNRRKEGKGASKNRQSCHSKSDGVSGTSCSSLCIHPWNKKAEPDDNSAPDDEENKLEIINILVEAKKKSLVQYQSLCKDLKSQNNGLKKEIEGISSSTHRNVTGLLEKYEDYATAAVAIKKNHTKEYYSAKLELKCTSVQLQKELEYLEQEVLDLNARLRHFHEDLQVLRTYKDKEYPVKEMQIARLVKNLDDLYLQQKTEKKELDKVTGGEDLKLRMQHSSRIENILETAASSAFASHTSAGVRHMAWHNNILRQEIEEHDNDVQDLEEAVRVLQEEVRVLRQLPESNLRKTVFSGVFFSPERCHPDEEVILDIPRQQPLPI